MSPSRETLIFARFTESHRRLSLRWECQV